jgi:S1-C subfamily serine protease
VDITAVSSAQNQGFPFGGGSSSQTDLGSGFEIDDKGDILTAAHVVDGASSITVTFQNGTTRSGQLLGEDRAWDVAVVKVNPSGITLHPLPLGSSRTLKVGDYLAAIGDPFGYDRSLSTGVVAGLDRTISAPNGFSIAYAIQTDAALNPGNSGGPVLDANGNVVGIADQIATDGGETGSDTAQSSGVGFAVPIDLAKIDVPGLEQGKPAAHAYLGVSTTDAPDAEGVLLQGVQSGTPAAAAGLRAGDVLIGFNGLPLHGSADLIDDIATEVPGNKVALKVKRGSRTLTVTVTLGTQPSEAPSGG